METVAEKVVSKPGMLSSEFWLMVAYFFLMAVNGTPYVAIEPEQMMMLATLVFGYGGGRTLVKNTIAKNGAS